MAEKDKGKLNRRKTSKTLSDKIHKHIADKNDVITEDDIKNVQIGEESFDKEEGAIGSLPDEIDKQSADISKAANEKMKRTPWDILDEEKG